MSLIGGRIITIERRGRFSDGQGGFLENWTWVASERGRIRAGSGGERARGMKVGAVVTHVAYLREGSNIKAQDRLKQGTMVLEVLAIRALSIEGGHLEVDCEEQQAGG